MLRVAAFCLSALSQAADPLPKFSTVSRGPDWKFDNEDGGPSSVGITQGGVDKDGWVEVKWLNGKVGHYRYGANGQFGVKKAGSPDPTPAESAESESTEPAESAKAAESAEPTKPTKPTKPAEASKSSAEPRKAQAAKDPPAPPKSPPPTTPPPVTKSDSPAQPPTPPTPVPPEEKQVNKDLFMASRLSGVEAADRIKDLVAAGGDVNVQIVHGWTSLHMAMIESYDRRDHDPIPAAKALMDGRADLNAIDGAGRTPLFYAVKKNSAALVELFKEAQELKLPRPGFSAMDRAMRDGHSVSVEALLHIGHDLEKDRGVPVPEVRRLLKKGDLLKSKSAMGDRMPSGTRRLLEETPKTPVEIAEEEPVKPPKEEMKRPDALKKLAEL